MGAEAAIGPIDALQPLGRRAGHPMLDGAETDAEATRHQALGSTASNGRDQGAAVLFDRAFYSRVDSHSRGFSTQDSDYNHLTLR